MILGRIIMSQPAVSFTKTPDPIPEFVADRLACGESTVRVFREYRGLSETELCQKSGIRLAHIYSIENGQPIMSKDALYRLAAALEVDSGVLDSGQSL
jgi:ribosome-binding protein aMBF1 (putative translation factor)